MCYLLNCSKQALNYHIRFLKQNGYINKIGYGVWERSKKAYLDSQTNTCNIRSHGLGFYLKIPHIPEWKSKKELILKSKQIPYTQDSLKQGLKIKIKSFHVFIYNKGIRFLQEEGKEYKVNSAKEGLQNAIYDVQQAIISLENIFDISLKINKYYHLKVTRQHHADIKNELANNSKKGLYVFDEKGLWLLIDFSKGTPELETVHGETADKDMDNIIMPFFNSLKKAPFTAYDFKYMYEITKSMTSDYADNIRLHLSTLQEMKEAIIELKETMRNKS
jgi:hypothetical protein